MVDGGDIEVFGSRPATDFEVVITLEFGDGYSFPSSLYWTCCISRELTPKCRDEPGSGPASSSRTRRASSSVEVRGSVWG